MKKIEKTQKNIGVNTLDTHTRKKLFNEFIEAGGEVIKEKDERGLSEFDRELQKKYREQIELIKKQNKTQQSDSKVVYKKTLNKSKTETKVRYRQSATEPEVKNISGFRMFFQRLKIKLRLFFMNVTDYSGYYLTLKFLKSFDEEYKTALLSSQMTYINLFRQNLRTGQKIMDFLDKMHPIYFELIELLSNIFDRTAANELLEHYYNFPDIPQETKELRDQLTGYFKKIYPLYAYKELLFAGLDKSLSIQARIEKKKMHFYSADKKKLKNDMYMIFNKFYPRLYYLMCYYEGRIFQSNRDIEETFKIPAEYLPGRRKRNSQRIFELQEKNKSAEADSQEEQKDVKESIPDYIKSGLELMSKINSIRSPEANARNNPFKSINKKDKVYIVNVLFEDFNREFSFILTTNKIKYNMISKTADSIDYKNKFTGIYNEIGKCKNRLLEYVKTLSAYEKLQREKPISSTQFIEYSNRLSALEKEKNQVGYEARMFVKAFLEKIAKELKIIMDDMAGNRTIVINPDDFILFETAIEGDKILNGKSVKEAISSTFNFLCAFIYRMSQNGDLYGESGIIDGEETLLESADLRDKETSAAPEKEEKKDETILKELDDLL